MGKIRTFIVIVSVIFLMAEFISPVIFLSKNGEIDNSVKQTIRKKGADNLPLSDGGAIQRTDKPQMPIITKDEG